jgi:hypothetical protein
MPNDPWRVPIQDLMLKAAEQRATHYREQAAQLREMANQEADAKLRTDLSDLAAQYDELANSVSR